MLETLLALIGSRKLHFWRDKQQREVGFVLCQDGNSCDAIECKWSAEGIETRGLKAFRENYPNGRNFRLSAQMGEPYSRRIKGLDVTFVHARDLCGLL